ncbi:hypothetical protein V1264_003037 [Littorina saxatilis]|uniref:Prokaryotic-type class I peptide chain release factors domain-containing protein n=3 Tax=Littorina saxatilis TaxID=31220 RepID=A0AAN9G7V2_9CAEN
MNAAKLRECSTTSFCHRHHLHTLCKTLLQPSKNRLTGFSSSLLLHTLAEYSLENSDYSDYLDSLLDEFTVLTEAKLKGENIDYSHFMFLEAVAMTMQELRTEYAELADLRSMLSGEVDKELQTMAETDIDNLTQHIQTLEEKLVDILVGPEPADKNDTMLEVSAGVGGQEAMLFTTEIFDMYSGYAYFKGWTFDLVDYEKSEMGGLRRASALISGTNVYKHLKFEAGVHRVQRVPKTERSGRVHTSTMTVAVLPQPSQIDISINPKDLNIDTFRSSGAGGQHVNTTESAVRITHKPSGTVAECQQERSQIKNREKAMKILLSRIYQKQVEDQETALRKKRKLQVGSAGRSEKIRTYNYSQDRITDHRGPITFYNVPQFLSGEDSMEDLLQTLMTQSRLQILQAMVDQFVDSQRRKK